MKILAGFAAALVVTTVGVFAAGGGDSLFNSDSGPSPCGSKSSCPLSAMTAPACCAHEADDATADAAVVATEASTPTTATKKKPCCSDE